MQRTVLSLAVALSFVPAAFAQQRTGAGAAVGGVTGAVIGGIIGHQNDETPEGVLIGGAVGAIAGGLIGRAQDNQIAQQRYQQQQAYQRGYQQQVYVQQQAVVASGMSTGDVVAMCRSGVSESVIMTQLNSRGVQRRLEVSEIISLHQQGVGDNVISAMQTAPLASQLAQPQQIVTQHVVTPPSSVIVTQQPVIYQQPTTTYYRSAPTYPHRHYYHSGSSMRTGF
jgi:outer membrane lipoprotein SlyB